MQAESKAKIWPVNYIINVKVLTTRLWQKQSEKECEWEKNQLKKKNCISLPAPKRKISVEVVENIKQFVCLCASFVGCM